MSHRHAVQLRKAIAGALPVFALTLSSCTSEWTLRTSRPAYALQWPYPPNPARLTLVESLTGLSAEKNAESVLRDIVAGSDPAESNSFLLPVAVATGPDGRIAVADMGRRAVHVYLPLEHRYERLTGTADVPLVSPVGVAYDDESRLFVSDSTGSVFGFSERGAVIFVLRSAGPERLLRPTGLAYSPLKKRLYVVDTLAHRIHVFGTMGDFQFSFGERGDGDGRFNFPTHLFRSETGELYVTDALNFRVQIFDESGKWLETFGRHGDGSGDLAMPKGIAVDSGGTIYLVDGLFDNVQLFDRHGGFLLTLGKRGSDFGDFWLPSGAFINKKNELYVCDTYNRRIQVFRITEGAANGAL